MQADILDSRPNNGKVSGLLLEDVNLIGALSYIAEETLNGIGRLNVPVYCGGERVKGQEVLLILRKAAYRFGIALRVLGFEGRQYQRVLLAPFSLSSMNGIQHIELLIYQTSLARGGRKQLRDICE